MTREARGDTVSVWNRAPVHTDTLFPKLITRFGSLDGRVEELFTSVQTFAVAENGDVYTFEPRIGVKHFDAGGGFKRLVAREGPGPMEVGYVVQMAIGPDGEVAMYDLRKARLSIFAESGVRIRTLPQGMPPFEGGGLLFDENAELWVHVTPPFPSSGGIQFPRPIFVRVNDSGEFVDTVFAPKGLGSLCPTLSEGIYRAGFWEDKREQWYAKAQWSMARNRRLAIGCPVSYQFDVIADEGKVLRIGRSWTPVLASREEREYYETFWQPIPVLPVERPAYAQLIATSDDRTWVWPVQPSETRRLDPETAALAQRQEGWQSGRTGAFDVFDEAGRWLGSVRVPDEAEYSGYPDTRPVVIRGDTLWFMIQDELDVSYIGRYELSWPER